MEQIIIHRDHPAYVSSLGSVRKASEYSGYNTGNDSVSSKSISSSSSGGGSPCESANFNADPYTNADTRTGLTIPGECSVRI